MSTSSDADAELSERFDKLATLIEATLLVQGKGNGGQQIPGKLPGQIADVVLLEAAKANITKTSDFVKEEIDKRLNSINQIISGYEEAFSKEKDIVNSLITRENGGESSGYQSTYTSTPGTSVSGAQAPKPAAAGSGTQAKPQVPAGGAAASQPVAEPVKVDVGKINTLLSDMVQKIKDAPDDEKKVMSKYVSDMESIFREMQGKAENTQSKK